MKGSHCIGSLITYGGLAQLARALDLHSRGHRFDSDILHVPVRVKFIDILREDTR